MAVHALWRAVLMCWLRDGDEVDTDDLADCVEGKTLTESDVRQPKVIRRPWIRRVINGAVPPV